MGKRKANSGFNTPFADLKLPKRPAPASEPPRPKEPKEPVHSPADDGEAFLRAMAGVHPLDGRDQRVEPSKRQSSCLPDDEQLALLELESLVQGKGEFRLFDSEESHAGVAPGVSDALLTRLKKGQFSFRRHLDLHGMTREAAKEEVTRFITSARRDAERCVLIVTGRGRGSPDGVSVLRETLPRWLSRAPLRSHVLAFASARNVDGGPGAFYVLLRRPGVRPYGIR